MALLEGIEVAQILDTTVVSDAMGAPGFEFGFFGSTTSSLPSQRLRNGETEYPSA